MPKGSKKQTAAKKPTQSVFFRAPQDVVQSLNASAKKFDLTQAQFLTKLVQWFERQEDKTKNDILIYDGHPAPLEQLENLVADLQVANHSFAIRRWVRAVEDHQAILLRKPQSASINHWVNYRLAYIWIDIGSERRFSAIRALRGEPSESGAGAEPNGDHLFAQALASLEHSVDLGRGIEGPMAVVAAFNRACAHSLRAQYLVERALLRNSSPWREMGADATASLERVLLAKQLPSPTSGATDAPPDLSKPPSHEAAVSAFHLLKERAPSNPLIDLIMRDCMASISALEDIVYNHLTGGTSGQTVEVSAEVHFNWLLSSCQNDPDLKFVASSEPCRQRLSTLVERLRDRKFTVTAWCQGKLERYLAALE